MRATVDGPDPAYGVFDTLLVRAGAPVDLEAHVDRLTHSVHELYDVPVDRGALAARITARATGLDTARVRTSYAPAAGEWQIKATRIEEPVLDPFTLELLRLPAGLGRHKWSDRRLVADPSEGDDVLIVDPAGVVLECGRANVFAVLADEVVTPPLDGRILAGTVRTRVLDLLPVSERAFTLADLADASEVFTSSSIRGVQPVTACLGVGSWPVGQTARTLRQGLK